MRPSLTRPLQTDYITNEISRKLLCYGSETTEMIMSNTLQQLKRLLFYSPSVSVQSVNHQDNLNSPLHELKSPLVLKKNKMMKQRCKNHSTQLVLRANWLCHLPWRYLYSLEPAEYIIYRKT